VTVQQIGMSNVKAAFMVVVACAFFAGANTFAKAVGLANDVGFSDIHPLQIAFARFFFGFLAISTVRLTIQRRAPWRPNAPFWIHFSRVTMGLGGLICVFWALTALPLADVTAIAFSSPIFTMFFAVMFLGEVVGIRRPIAAVVAFIGVLVMVQPTSDSFHILALVALLGAVFTGAEVVFVRVLAQRDHPVTILLINNALGALMALALAFPVLSWPSVAQWPLLAGVGIAMVTGQLIFVRAMAVGEANFLAPYYYSNLLYAALFGFLFFGELPQWTSYVGAALIVGSGIYIAFRTK
jgi:drug/metabolite transporter (DMT)-like permease